MGSSSCHHVGHTAGRPQVEVPQSCWVVGMLPHSASWAGLGQQGCIRESDRGKFR